LVAALRRIVEAANVRRPFIVVDADNERMLSF